MADSQRDLTPLAPLGRGRLRSGPVRAQRPVYVDLLPPCNNACPAGENILGWLGHARVGKDEEAWRLLTADNPFASIHGRVCYHPCETNCNRKELDGSVSIHAVERYLGDLATERGWQFPVPEVQRPRAAWHMRMKIGIIPHRMCSPCTPVRMKYDAKKLFFHGP